MHDGLPRRKFEVGSGEARVNVQKPFLLAFSLVRVNVANIYSSFFSLENGINNYRLFGLNKSCQQWPTKQMR